MKTVTAWPLTTASSAFKLKIEIAKLTEHNTHNLNPLENIWTLIADVDQHCDSTAQ